MNIFNIEKINLNISFNRLLNRFTNLENPWKKSVFKKGQNLQLKSNPHKMLTMVYYTIMGKVKVVDNNGKEFFYEEQCLQLFTKWSIKIPKTTNKYRW